MQVNFDDGYAFGRGAFETIKVVDGSPLFLDDHLKRLRKAAKFFDIDFKLDKDEIFNYINEKEDKNFALKLILSDGNFILVSRKDSYRDNYDPFSLLISDVRKSSTSKILYHKSLSYYENIMEDKRAKEKGFTSALFLNEKGQVTETCYGNIFFVKDSIIYTPSIDSGLLEGTMRSYIMEEYPVKEKRISSEELGSFDEAFISNSLMGVRSINKINDISYGQNKVYRSVLKKLKPLGF